MEERLICTTDPTEFLLNEFSVYQEINTYKNYQEYLDNVEEMVRKCTECGFLYWDGCDKRCEHE